jgi:25S rRNA (uracil2634-N3)-methyltransferase
MAKVKVCDNRGQARKKAKIAAYGKMRKVQKIGVHKLVSAAPVLVGRPAQKQPQQQVPRKPHNVYANDAVNHVLLLGEGDFGFAASLATLWGDCSRLVATAMQSEAEVLSQAGAEDNVETIRACGGTVLFGVDASRLHSGHDAGRKRGFDRVVFNFPLVSGGRPKDPPAITGANQLLLREVFQNASTGSFLAEAGELHITVPRGQPYEGWSLPTLAKLAKLRVKRAVPFEMSCFPGYTPSGAPHTGGGALTYVLVKAEVRTAPDEQVQKKFGGSVKEMNRQRRKKARKP